MRSGEGRCALQINIDRIMSTIVIIEEDLAMRALLCEWLRGDGYHALPCPTIDACAGAPTTHVDLVIADLPNLRSNGLRRVNDVRRQYPHSAVIGLSTQLDLSLPGESELARAFAIRALVAKPCSRAELIDAVRSAIGSAG